MISVDQLAAIPSLGLRFLAGRTGGGRLVTWAHACDLPDPWRWFDKGDLVMTTGTGLPAEADQQAEWMAELISSNVSALVIAAGPDAPEVSERLLSVAEARGFPVLSASFDLHFVSLARTVIESAVENERQRLATIKRLYDVYWQSLHARGTLADRMSALEGATGWALEIRDHAAGEVVASGRQALRTTATGADGSVQTPIPGVGEMLLVASPGRSPVTDNPLLQHVGGLIALELEHEAAQRDLLRASGQDLLAGLLDETVTLPGVWPELRHRGMSGPIVVALWGSPGGGPLAHESIHRQVCLQAHSPLLMPRLDTLLALVPRDPELLTTIAKKLAPGCAVGVSLPLAANSNVAEAARQAQWGLAHAHDHNLVLSVYGEDTEDVDLLPRSVEESRRIARRILGPLLDYDKRNDGELLTSVRVFLTNDGSWQKTADELGIHRQTLVYRLRRAEELTGLKPTSTEGATQLWLALCGADRANLKLDDLAT